MIPKKLHYCWFGGGQKPELAEQCIASWKRFCPDYEIIEWNETNLDLESFPAYVKEAYAAKKWGFVPDYIRIWIVYTYGGIYLDTDVEMIKPFDTLLLHPAFFGFESDKCVNLGHSFGAEAGNPLLLELMQDYEKKHFLLPDGSLDLTPSPQINTEIFKRHGLLLGGKTYQEIEKLAVVYPIEYFCPIDYYSGELKVTKNTYSIHHYMASWQSKKQKRIDRKKGKLWKEGDPKKDYLAVKEEKGTLYALLWSIKRSLTGK